MNPRVSLGMASFLVMLVAHCPAADFLTLKQSVPLPGVAGRIDHFSLDSTGGRLFVCALGNNSLEVIDVKQGKRNRSIKCPGAPQGVGYSPETNRLLVANDEGGICQLFDAPPTDKLFSSLNPIDLKDDADNVRYDSGNFFVGYGNGGIAIIQAQTGKLIGSIKLPGHPEAFVLEQTGKRIFVNIPTSREIAVIDRQKGQVIQEWKTGTAFANFPMALDEKHHRLLVGCRLPARLLVIDTESGEIVAKFPIGGDTDDVFYDSKRHRIYVICGAGQIDVIDQTDSNHYTPLTTISTAKGARTGMLSPELDELFVAVPHRDNQPAEIRIYTIE